MSKIKKVLNVYKSLPVTAKASIWFVFCTLFQKGIGFITVPIFTRIMSPEEYGIYGTYLSWYSIVVVFCTLNMNNCIYINKLSKLENEKQKNEAGISLLSLASTITLVLFIIYLIFHEFFNKITGLNTIMTCLLFTQILFVEPFNFWTMKNRYNYKYIKLVLITILYIILNSILGIVFVLLFSKKQSLARVASCVLVQVVFGATAYFTYIYKSKKIFLIKDWKHALKVQLPLLPHGLSLTILQSSDRIMINNIINATAAAIYSVAYSAGYIINILKNSIVDALRPWIYEKIKQKDYKAINENTKPIMILVLVMDVIFVAFAPEIIKILAPSQYYEAIYVIPPVAASAFFTFLYNIFSVINFYYEKSNSIMVASVSGAILNIGLNFIFIRLFGYVVAGYTTLVCYMFLAFAHYLLMKKTCKENIKNAQLFDIKFTLCLSIIILLITLVFTIIYDYFVIRYCIIGISLLLIVVKKQYFTEILKKITKKEA